MNKAQAKEPKMEEIDEVTIHPDFPKHKIQIGARINNILRDHDYFAWSHEDITWISPEVAMHRLQVDPDYLSIRQKRRKFALEQN